MIKLSDAFPPPLSRMITLREALADFPLEEMDPSRGHIWIDESPNGRDTVGYRLAVRASQGQYFQRRHRREIWDAPSLTLTRGSRVGRPPYIGDTGCHPLITRTFSPAEMKRIGSFPDPFQIGGDPDRLLINAVKLIGNSVPPLMTAAIGGRVAEVLGRGVSWVPDLTTNYPDFLSLAWEDHRRDRREDAPTVISLFSGCGGSSLGYSMAGYREIAAVEIDGLAAETFRLNFDCPLLEEDVRAVTAGDLMDAAGIGPGDLDLLDASPPCQTFSVLTGQNGALNDERSALYLEFIRLLEGLRPRAFIMENVKGLIQGRARLMFASILREMKAAGYAVEARVINAGWLGVPQTRERLIFIGVRGDIMDGGEPHGR